jgi:2-iminobutanoate/2-iminopropanoate deaminase
MAPHKRHNPSSIAAPANNLYSHGVETQAGCRMLHVAGQVGVRPDGTIASTVEEQTEQVMANIKAILESANMALSDIIKINSYLLKADDIIPYARIRNKHLGGIVPPATTAVVVAGLVKPEWLVEVEVIAASQN